MTETGTTDTLTLTAEIVASYLGATAHVKVDEIPDIIRSVRAALSETKAPQSASTEEAFPKADKRAASKSITPDALISFIDNNRSFTEERSQQCRWIWANSAC